MPLNRLKKQTTKGVLWIYILKLLSEENLYAYDMNRKIEERFNFKPARITVYTVLYRLMKDGYVDSKRIGNRKYYRITKKGKTLLNEGVEYIYTFLSNIK